MFFSFASIKNTIRLSAYAYISTYDIRQPNAHVCLQIYASKDAACNLLMGETAANQMLSLYTTAMYWLPVGSNYFQSIRIKKQKQNHSNSLVGKQTSLYVYE